MEETVYAYLKNRLNRFGRVKLFGSARKGRAFRQGHDFDIGLFTSFTSKELLVHAIKQLFNEWDDEKCIIQHKNLPLHVFVIGDFSPEMIRVNKNLIQFVPKHSRWLSYLLVIVWKKYLKLIGRERS